MGRCQDREVARMSNRNGELLSTGCQEGQESGEMFGHRDFVNRDCV